MQYAQQQEGGKAWNTTKRTESKVFKNRWQAIYRVKSQNNKV